MRYLLSLFMAITLMLNVACAKHGNHVNQEKSNLSVVKTKVITVKEKLILNHTKDYKTMAQSIPKMPPSKQFQYDDQYAIPDVKGEETVNASALIIPPGSKR